MKVIRAVCFSLASFGAFGMTAAHAQEPASMPEAYAPAHAVRVSAAVIAGQRIAGESPVYPADAKSQGVSGAVVLHAIIGTDGNVQSLAVVSGNSLLSEAALNAVKTWVYKPYLLNGQPTEVDTTITVNFNLDPAAPPA